MGQEAGRLNKVLTMIVRGKLDEAEKHIEGFKPTDEYEKGYLKGLKGIIYSLRKPVDKSVVESDNPAAYFKSIKESMKIHYLSKEEEGFFSAWVDFLKKLPSREENVVKEEPGKQPG